MLSLRILNQDMQPFGQIGKFLIITGILLVVVGLFFFFFRRIPWLGRLSGDIYIKRENFTFYFPVTTCILMSIIITLLIALFKFIKK